MKSFVPRVAAIQDISCLGRCSLTVIMPILSAMGIQVCPLPTAVFSTHLGGFGRPACCDFTDYMESFVQHWQQQGMTFDCIYSGFLASEQQIDIVERTMNVFSANHPFVLVDPVMGDGGKLYTTYTKHMQERMKQLVAKADVITPNYTEACFLLGEPYDEAVCDLGKMTDWLARLSDLGPERVVITGIFISQEKLLTLGYDQKNAAVYQVFSDYIPAKYPGTGDVFASVLLGSLLRGASLPCAMEQAADFVAEAIRVTLAFNTPPREGILLETILSRLCLSE
ncbi:pyridoxine kinase [Sporomusaceae bacterium BoRhaA]|uniref:pyridoxamine kinase n=1 Tax=Pelorhabdus rhamnosifermentans TaxID=2772457 RepID=UPI001C06050E|nr:pyridoxamine kinase [Pelorhabdus rhamnosifermentans]MBU2700839.1 pyridoxine kinase [Pelorhabdus rhamnosifermentans]